MRYIDFEELLDAFEITDGLELLYNLADNQELINDLNFIVANIQEVYGTEIKPQLRVEVTETLVPKKTVRTHTETMLIPKEGSQPNPETGMFDPEDLEEIYVEREIVEFKHKKEKLYSITIDLTPFGAITQTDVQTMFNAINGALNEQNYMFIISYVTNSDISSSESPEES